MLQKIFCRRIFAAASTAEATATLAQLVERRTRNA